MSELEKLLNEKRALDDRIRLLKEGCSNFGSLSSIRYLQKSDVDDGRTWQVSSQMKQTHREYETREEAKKNGHEWRDVIKAEYEVDRWQVFIREKTKEDAMKKIKQIIEDLKTVLNVWSSEEAE